MLGASALEPQVVLGADASQHSQLLAPQTRRATTPTSDQPDFLRTNLVPTSAQEITEGVAFRHHGWSLCPASTGSTWHPSSSVMFDRECMARQNSPHHGKTREDAMTVKAELRRRASLIWRAGCRRPISHTVPAGT
jgi:hypothetical protein